LDVEINGKKATETPQKILGHNTAAENRRWRGPSKSASKDDSNAAPEHLTEPTKAGKYTKQDNIVDSRELGWKSYFTKQGKIVIPGNETTTSMDFSNFVFLCMVIITYIS